MTERRVLPTISAEQFNRILSMPKNREIHATLLAEMPFIDTVEVSSAPAPMPLLDRPVRVLSWNAERCKHVRPSANFLKQNRTDIYLLTEMDWGLVRSGQAHTTRELAEHLGCGYVFAVEFLELDLGDEDERKKHAGETNRVGYHGGAILCRQAIVKSRLVRLETSGDWFDGQLGERRIGGRIALMVSVPVSGVDVTFVSTHLESESDPHTRGDQMRTIFEAVESFSPGAPAVIGGDLNTFSLGHAQLKDRDLRAQALREDPRRLVSPVQYEPMFTIAKDYGYEWESCNHINEPTTRRSLQSSTERGKSKIDWFFCRHLITENPEVISAINQEDNSALSDHEAIAITIRVR